MTARNAEVAAKVQHLCKLGVPLTRIAKELGISRNSVYYHLNRVEAVAEAVRRRRSPAPKPSDGAASPVEDDLAPDEEAAATHRTSLQEGAA